MSGESEVKTDDDQVKSLEAKINALENELHTSQTELKATLRKLSKAERHYEKASETNEVLRKENERLSQQLHDFKSALKNRVEVEVQTDEAQQEYGYSSSYCSYEAWHHAATRSHSDPASGETSGESEFVKSINYNITWNIVLKICLTHSWVTLEMYFPNVFILKNRIFFF